MRPSEERAAGLAPFSELKTRLEQDWKTERREKDALAQLEPAAKELASGATLVSLAQRYGTEVKTSTEFGPAGPVPEIGAAPELAVAVFQTPQGQAGRPVAVPNGFVLFRVLTRNEASREAFADAEGRAAGVHPEPRSGPPDALLPAADAGRAQGRGQRPGARLVPARHGRRTPELTATIGA